MTFMISVARTIAAASTSLTLLTGAAQAQEQASKLVDLLDLPVGQPETYFNNATKSAVTEQCFRQDANTVACHMRVMTNEALIDATYQGVVYHMDDAGKLSVSNGTPDVAKWTTNTFNNHFKPAAKANNHFTWNPSSPLAAPAGDKGILQNDVRSVTAAAGGQSVTLCSNLPLNENRGLQICTIFGAATVQSAATIKALGNGAVVTSQEATAVRPEKFDVTSEDQYYLEKYLKQSANGPAFTVAGPYNPR